ncbi:glycosytransferase [Pseudomonas izuensis]|uniref:glycosytransferase n=1 Tax=Pseudomonas izuensis TaxID=2684212 RepID=UPI001357C28E|nr:glycosytransferase [Pseudomonas izuensis]
MRVDKTVRVMWLLNHSSARKFEVAMLKRIGISEIFTPKSFPQEISYRSASVSYEEDGALSIPSDDLALLNAQDWHAMPSKQAWEVANKYFDVMFFILHNPEVLNNIARNFKGAVLWRAYGLDASLSYGKILSVLAPDHGQSLRRIGARFWFAQAYEHLHEIEPLIISRSRVYLPLGIANSTISDGWNGGDKRIYFVCPDIETNIYYTDLFKSFKSWFEGMPYVVAGAQAIQPSDPAVLGYVPQEIHERNMREFRLMFYHSVERNHVHYHPFEAVRAGMPLVFMAGGMLDRLGGKNLPGRCETIKDARAKISRILNDDKELIDAILKSQSSLLEPMKLVNCEQSWRDGFTRILSELAISRAEDAGRTIKTKRIAVILPVAYGGGSLRGAKLLAQAIYQGSVQYGEHAEVVFFHLDNGVIYSDEHFSDLPSAIKRRTFKWITLQADEARRAMRYAGHVGWEPLMSQYMAVEDGFMQLNDCDLLVVVSDRLPVPLLPLKPYILMVYDYLQRYVKILPRGADQSFINAARQAERVLVSTEFTRRDALQYAGVLPSKVFKVPMLAPDFSANLQRRDSPESTYFVWTTNAGRHKNHEAALEALKWYYEELGGKLECIVTGVNTAALFKKPPKHLKTAVSKFKQSKLARKKVSLLGELPDREYQRTLAGAAFLWHAGTIDNGTFSVIEAASLGVPSLSSDYAAMREIDLQFSLNLAWMNGANPKDMAEQLKSMESSYGARKAMLPNSEIVSAQSVECLSGEYWKVLRECL